jgi:Holliday junction resolvase RusA-like endonuclease
MNRITLPLPPSINSMYSQSRSGHRFKTNFAKAWEMEASFIVKRLKKYGKAKVEVAYTYYFADNRSDLGNRSKILTDLLQKTKIIDNDSQVWVIHEYKNIDKYKPRVELEIWPIE